MVLVAAAAVQAAVTAGDRLPDFRVAGLHGGSIARADLAGKVAVVDFWASWCLPCREALPALDALARRFGDRLAVIAIGVDHDRATAERFAAERLPSPALALAHDAGGGLMARLGAPGMPALFVVDCDGVVRRVVAGYSTEELRAVEQEVATLLDGACGARPAGQK
jgi:thiol-disulfide isomerase/thioredoxin